LDSTRVSFHKYPIFHLHFESSGHGYRDSLVVTTTSRNTIATHTPVSLLQSIGQFLLDANSASLQLSSLRVALLLTPRLSFFSETLLLTHVN
jgi:hypothetical protein